METNNMKQFKEYDWIKITAEKNVYAENGIHKGMFGWICDSRTIDGTWLVAFPQCGEHRDIEIITVHEKDMTVTTEQSVLFNELRRIELGENEPGEILTVEVIEEKDEYIGAGVYKGMQGVVYFQNEDIWHTYFVMPQTYEAFADIEMQKSDLKEIDRMSPDVNERIKAERAVE